MINLKDLYSKEFYDELAGILKQTIPLFDANEFDHLIFSPEFENYELKERMAHTAKVLHHFLSENFAEVCLSLRKIIHHIEEAEIKDKKLEYMFFAEYISMYGMDDYDHAVQALEFVTQFTSCEFAVRPFILKYPERMIPQMLAWSKHESKSVRRLASEGSRPRLPWAMALPFLKNDPSPILPILDNLKQDSCEIVRRSVANNLNDITKDNPQVVIEIAKKWKGISPVTDGIIKHACRSLLKSAHPEILAYYGLKSDQVSLDSFTIKTPVVKIGDNLEFDFSITNQSNKPMKIRLEYGLYYKRGDNFSKKVFKISEREFRASETCSIVKKQSFRLITTRRFYAGEHKLSLIANGEEKAILSFALVD